MVEMSLFILKECLLEGRSVSGILSLCRASHIKVLSSNLNITGLNVNFYRAFISKQLLSCSEVCQPRAQFDSIGFTRAFAFCFRHSMLLSTGIHCPHYRASAKTSLKRATDSTQT